MTRTHEKVTDAPPGNRTTSPPAADENGGEACLGPEGAADRVQRALRVIHGRWKLAILFRLFATPALRFSELQRAIGQVSHKMLVAQLRQLERDGVIQRTVYPTAPPKVEYRLTDSGQALRPILLLLRRWP